MQNAKESIFERIETAISDWTQTVTGAHDDLSAYLGRARQQLELTSQPGLDTRQRVDVSGIDEIGRGLAEYNRIAKAATDRLAEAIQTLGATRMAGAEGNGLEMNEDGLTHELETLRNEFQAIKESLAGISLLAFKLDEIRDLLLERHARQTAHHGTPKLDVPADAASPQDDIARLLVERQQAHEEIVTLRAEIDLLRRANASLCLADRPEPAEPQFQPVDAAGQRRRMGMILVDAGIITHTQLDDALSEQLNNPHKRLGTVLIEKGYTSERVIAQVLAGQLRLPLCDLSSTDIEPASANRITKKVAMHNVCIPIRETRDTLVLAMANPLDLIAIEDVELLTGLNVEPVVATMTEIAAAIERHYRS